MRKIAVCIAFSDAAQRERITETAEKLGFSNQFYFCTVFKKFSALTPSEFRRREMAEIAKKLLTNK